MLLLKIDEKIVKENPTYVQDFLKDITSLLDDMFNDDEYRAKWYFLKEYLTPMAFKTIYKLDFQTQLGKCLPNRIKELLISFNGHNIFNEIVTKIRNAYTGMLSELFELLDK